MGKRRSICAGSSPSTAASFSGLCCCAEGGRFLLHPAVAVGAEGHRDLPDRQVQHHPVDFTAQDDLADDVRRAQGRVTGEGHFGGGGEDAHVETTVPGLVGEDESGLGEVDLARQALHGRTVKISGVAEDG